MDIKKNLKNELFGRQEISFLVALDQNPSFKNMKKLVSKEFSKPEENIDVYNIGGKFGRNTFLVKAYVYDSETELKKAIQKTRRERREEAKALLEAKKAEIKTETNT